MKRAVVFGSEGMNGLGLVQSLGREGVYVICILIGQNESRLIKHSKYVKEIFYAHDISSGINLLLQKCVYNEPTVIIPSGDGVAKALEQNKTRLKDHFIFEHMAETKSISFYMNKLNQHELAKAHGFNVPFTVGWGKGDLLPSDMIYPCIVKPLVSCEGDKRDIMMADNKDQLSDILNKHLQFTSRVIVQQRIDRDYEYNMMGCSFTDGSVCVPLSLRAVKFNSFLQNATTVCYIEPLNDRISVEVGKIKRLMRDIGYVGLFSVEFMHNREDDVIYFTEINFRNDGLNSFIVNNGANLPYLHLLDLLNLPKKEYTVSKKSKKYICEARHMSGLMRRVISLREWLTDLIGVKGFLYYFKDDKWPFYYQFIEKLLPKL